MSSNHQPAPKSVQIYNKLIETPYDDQENIARFEWQLLLENRKNPLDMELSVALLQAYAMQGKAEDANVLAKTIWPHRMNLGVDAYQTYLALLTCTGFFERVVEECPRETVKAGHPLLRGAFLESAFALGSVELISEFADLCYADDAQGRKEFRELIKLLAENGLLENFVGHQKVVADVMAGKFTEYHFAVQDSDDDFELIVNYFVRGDRKERRLLENAIDDALSEFYLGLGREPFFYEHFLNYLVLDISSHWQPSLYK